MAKVLIVLSAASRLPLNDGSELPTGFWAQEFVPPYHILLEHGHEVHVATPGGRPAALDGQCLEPRFQGDDPGRALNLREQLDGIESWREPQSLSRLALIGSTYDAVFLPGGHGPVVDLAGCAPLGELLKRTLAGGGLVGAVCHGPAGLLPATHDGRWLFEGYRMTCFSPAEEQSAGLAARLPWQLDARLGEIGGRLSFAPPGQAHVVEDRQLYTGQNPASAAPLAFGMARRLKKMASRDKAACGGPQSC